MPQAINPREDAARQNMALLVAGLARYLHRPCHELLVEVEGRMVTHLLESNSARAVDVADAVKAEPGRFIVGTNRKRARGRRVDLVTADGGEDDDD